MDVNASKSLEVETNGRSWETNNGRDLGGETRVEPGGASRYWCGASGEGALVVL
jgi:hypothetical protein